MENDSRSKNALIECPNCHCIMAGNETSCSVCKFDLVVKDHINIEEIMKLSNI